MNLTEALRRVRYINEIKGDDEAAHVEEDRLYSDFVKDIATRKDRIGKIAKTIMSSKSIVFYRWYA